MVFDDIDAGSKVEFLILKCVPKKLVYDYVWGG